MRAFLLSLILMASVLAGPSRAADAAPEAAAATAATAATAKGTSLTFVLLREARLPDPQTVRRHLEARLAGRLKIEVVPSEDKDKDKDKGKGKPEQVMLLRVAGGTAMIGLLDVPLPTGQIDDLCAAAWYWPGACAETAKHRAQLIVSVIGTTLDRLDRSLLLTDLVAAAMEGNDNAIASYWLASLRPRDMFLKASAGANRANPPVWLWVDFRLSREADKSVSVSTDGMHAYGLRELEAKGVKRPAREVFDLILGTANYLVAQGPVIKDGDTIGASPELGIVVRLDKSYWREGMDVYRVVWTK